MSISWKIRPEEPGDLAAIEALNAASFGPGRLAKSAYRLREGVAPVGPLSLVAVEEKVLRGSVRFWPVHADGQELLLLGPLAVQPGQRGRGIGIALMEAGIAAAKKGPWPAILLVGDEPYYARVGFHRLPPGLLFPGPVDPDRVLGLSLKGGEMPVMTGPVRKARIDQPACAPGAGMG